MTPNLMQQRWQQRPGGFGGGMPGQPGQQFRMPNNPYRRMGNPASSMTPTDPAAWRAQWAANGGPASPSATPPVTPAATPGPGSGPGAPPPGGSFGAAGPAAPPSPLNNIMPGRFINGMPVSPAGGPPAVDPTAGGVLPSPGSSPFAGANLYTGAGVTPAMIAQLNANSALVQEAKPTGPDPYAAAEAAVAKQGGGGQDAAPPSVRTATPVTDADPRATASSGGGFNTNAPTPSTTAAAPPAASPAPQFRSAQNPWGGTAGTMQGLPSQQGGAPPAASPTPPALPRNAPPGGLAGGVQRIPGQQPAPGQPPAPPAPAPAASPGASAAGGFGGAAPARPMFNRGPVAMKRGGIIPRIHSMRPMRGGGRSPIAPRGLPLSAPPPASIPMSSAMPPSPTGLPMPQGPPGAQIPQYARGGFPSSSPILANPVPMARQIARYRSQGGPMSRIEKPMTGGKFAVNMGKMNMRPFPMPRSESGSMTNPAYQ